MKQCATCLAECLTCGKSTASSLLPSERLCVQTLRAPVTSVSDMTKEAVQVLKFLLNVKFPVSKIKIINQFLSLTEKITQNGK